MHVKGTRELWGFGVMMQYIAHIVYRVAKTNGSYVDAILCPRDKHARLSGPYICADLLFYLTNSPLKIVNPLYNFYKHLKE
jgi:hypothetical protein